MFGTSLLFLEPIDYDESKAVEDTLFECVLDCRDLDFVSVEEVVIPGCQQYEFSQDQVGDWRDRSEAFDRWFQFPTLKTINFQAEPWCLRLSKEGGKTAFDFPRTIKIRWVTRPEGKSLLWRKDQQGLPSVFTPAAAVNNRSLFPCQEPPIAMASWQCVLSGTGCSEDTKFFCTGDEDAIVGANGENSDGVLEYYFFTRMVLPMSTFAVAAGRWTVTKIVENSYQFLPKDAPSSCKRKHDPYPCHIDRGDVGPVIPCRLIGPERLVSTVSGQWKNYLPACLTAAHSLLGPHPFQKLDIVILPRCYSGLGLSSPSLMFVSQSVVINCDGHNLVRLAHEISHSWFGLVVGALDWTEEWLSEGFATFAEDHIHAKAMDLLAQQGLREFAGYPLKDFSWSSWDDCRSWIKYKTLAAELDATPAVHQIMRPMAGKELRDPETDVAFVKNGQNPELTFTQVNYLKGYFLLRHFCDTVGQDKFFALLRYYVHELYHGCLVHSTDFLTLFFKSFPEHYPPEKCEDNVKKICSEWLDVPSHVVEKYETLNEKSPLIQSAFRVLKTVPVKRAKKRKVSGSVCKDDKTKDGLVAEQLIILLEMLLERAKLSKDCLRDLDKRFAFATKNADVQHRWCELIVKHGFKENLDFVRDFLREHQAMGVYMYAELALKSRSFNAVAKDVFEELKGEMDPSTVVNISEMLNT